MISRSALSRLGKSVAQDLASGHPGEGSRTAGDLLAAHPRAALDIVDLAAGEVRKKRPDDELITAYALMFGQSLETLRYAAERSDAAAATILDTVRSELNKVGDTSPQLLILLCQQFASAKLDIGADLRAKIGALVQDRCNTTTAQGDAAAEYLGKVSKEHGGDPFAIHAEFAEITSALPDEHRNAVAHAMVWAAPDAPAREAAVGWLLDPSAGVRTATAQEVARAADEGLLSGPWLRRLIVIRNWLPGAERPAIDAAIRASRRGGVEPAPLRAAQVQATFATMCDGAGAQSFFVLVRQRRKNTLAALLVKHGVGVRDAWLSRDMSKAEAKSLLDVIDFEVGLFPASMEQVSAALPHFLALNDASGVLPPIALLDVLETIGMAELNPRELPVEELTMGLLEAGQEDGAEAAVVEEALAASESWPDFYEFMDTWFEDDAMLDTLLAGKRFSRRKRVDIVLEAMLPARRRRWGEMLAWTATTLRGCDSSGVWIDMALVAREIVGERPLTEIPLMRRIADATVEAWLMRRAG